MADTRRWAASAIQSGTNERMYVEGDSKEEVQTKLYGQAYGPKYGTVTFYRIGEIDAIAMKETPK